MAKRREFICGLCGKEFETFTSCKALAEEARIMNPSLTEWEIAKAIEDHEFVCDPCHRAAINLQ